MDEQRSKAQTGPAESELAGLLRGAWEHGQAIASALCGVTTILSTRATHRLARCRRLPALEEGAGNSLTGVSTNGLSYS